MSEYIKRELAVSSIALETDMSLEQARKILGSVPSIDIVLCKDCEYFVPRTDHTGLCGWHKAIGDNVGVAVNDYCSFGKREEQENENKNN